MHMSLCCCGFDTELKTYLSWFRKPIKNIWQHLDFILGLYIVSERIIQLINRDQTDKCQIGIGSVICKIAPVYRLHIHVQIIEYFDHTGVKKCVSTTTKLMKRFYDRSKENKWDFTHLRYFDLFQRSCSLELAVKSTWQAVL